MKLVSKDAFPGSLTLELNYFFPILLDLHKKKQTFRYPFLTLGTVLTLKETGFSCSAGKQLLSWQKTTQVANT